MTVLKRLSDGTGTKQKFAHAIDNGFQAQADFSVSQLRNGTRTYNVGRLEASARLTDRITKSDPSDEGMVIPIVVKLSASAPVGTDLRLVKNAAERVFATFIGSKDIGEVGDPEMDLHTQVFFPVVNTISLED